ncbi:Uncharacterised protein [uncultured archaeon]|nr:Uncharacterised protein [uncultured archaeon]
MSANKFIEGYACPINPKAAAQGLEEILQSYGGPKEDFLANHLKFLLKEVAK